MYLRRKVCISILVGFTVFALFNVLISQCVVFPGFKELQNDYAKKDIERCVQAIESEIRHLATISLDWSMWDDAYAFVQDRNQGFITSNLTSTILEQLKINAFYFYDADGNVVWGKCYDLAESNGMKIADYSDEILIKNHFLLEHNNNEGVIAGIIVTPAGPMMVSSRPIIQSDGSGPIKGTLIMGRLIDDEYITQMSEQTNVKFKLLNIQKAKLSDVEKKVMAALSLNSTFEIKKTSNELHAYGAMFDLKKQTMFLVKADIDRAITKKGANVVSLLLSSAFATLIIFAILFYSTLNKVVLNRIKILQKDISLITQTGNLSLRTKLVRKVNKQENDEIEYLGDSFNDMIEKLESTDNQLKNATRIKSEFLANMSHEIRTPMNAIIGFGDLLAEEKLSHQQRLYVNTIRSAGQNLLILINDILDFSKIEAGKLTIDKTECDLGEILGHIDSLMRPAASNKGLDFQILQCGPLPQKITTDFTRVCQCLINLVNNAIKFTEKGHVYVNVTYEKNNDSPFVRFDVEDTGIGISDKAKETIFESFTQADSSTTRRYGGTGLGLTISRKLIQMLDGQLTLKSIYGKGSTFTFTIPADSNVRPTEFLDKYNFVNHFTDPALDEKQLSFSGSVLVAEDNPSSQMLIKLLLEKVGITAEMANNGVEAVELAMNRSFDLILMDMQMPKLNGYEATRELRRNGLKTPIIALTANAMKDDDKICFSAGCSDYLSKPIKKKQLHAMLAKYLGEVEMDPLSQINDIGQQVDDISRLCRQIENSQDKSSSTKSEAGQA
jgi:signal transduction histidine kinase/CheY-like chemotaxis protein